MTEQLPSDSLATPKTDAVALSARTLFGVYPGFTQYVEADFARAQERRIAELEQALRYALKYEDGEAACVRHWRFVARDVLEIKP